MRDIKDKRRVPANELRNIRKEVLMNKLEQDVLNVVLAKHNMGFSDLMRKLFRDEAEVILSNGYLTKA